MDTTVQSNFKASTHLGVDAGMMALVPEALYTGKYPEVNAALLRVKTGDSDVDANTQETAIVFRLREKASVWLGITKDGTDVARLDIGQRFNSAYFMGITPPTPVSHIILPAGIYLLGDPCYLLDPDKSAEGTPDRSRYFQVCEAMNPGFGSGTGEILAYNDCAVVNIEGQIVAVCESGVGDGSYEATVQMNRGSLLISVVFLPEEDLDENRGW